MSTLQIVLCIFGTVVGAILIDLDNRKVVRDAQKKDGRQWRLTSS